MSSPEVIMVARNSTIAELVQQCADGILPFSGPDSLCSKVNAMGFSFNGLYEAVRATRPSVPQPEQQP